LTRMHRNPNIRGSMHPGQYTVLNSPNEEVVEKSIMDLEYHCKFLDSLGVDYSNKIILHVGGVYGDKISAMERFKHNFNRLSNSLKKRLVIENDDKSYTIEDVLIKIHIYNVQSMKSDIFQFTKSGRIFYTLLKIHGRLKMVQ